MPLSPNFEMILAHAEPLPDFNEVSIEDIRENARSAVALTPKLEVPLASIVDRSIVCATGELPVRVYTPEGEGPFPMLVYCHGGGFAIGDLDLEDNVCRGLSNMASCVVMSVDYRLAPEHKFPAATDDAYAALEWAAQNAAELNADPQRIAVGGGSAGGLLSAVSTLRSRDANGPKVVAQLLIYPGIEPTNPEKYPSIAPEFESTFIRISDAYYYWSCYLNGDDDKTHPHAAPICADSHANLPPAYIVTAEHDIARDEGAEYARVLEAAGVPTVYNCFPGAPHGFMSFVGILPEVTDCLSEIAAWLSTQFENA